MGRELQERLISSEVVFEGRLISVRVDEVELAEGRRARREVVVHPESVAVVPLLPDGQVILIRQYRHAARRVLWELPAGICGPGERPADCARRELSEEVGYEAGELSHLFSTYLSPGFSTELIHVFVARGLTRVGPHLEPDEEIEAHPVPLERAAAMVARGEVQNAAAICGLLAAAHFHAAGGGGSSGAIE